MVPNENSLIFDRKIMFGLAFKRYIVSYHKCNYYGKEMYHITEEWVKDGRTVYKGYYPLQAENEETVKNMLCKKYQ